MGFTGMGVGFCLGYVLYTVQEYIMTRKYFHFRFIPETIKKCFPLIVICFAFSMVLIAISNPIVKYLIGFIMLSIVSFISYKWMDEMINLKASFKALRNRIKH
jgi:O-antigen/teichoic acid export membrane protein